MPRRERAAMGWMIADTLRSSWRDCPEAPPIRTSVTLPLARRLLETGCAGLAWRRLASSGPGASVRTTAMITDTPHTGEGARALRRGYLIQLVEADARANDVADAIGQLASAGVEPLLLKGWSVASRYPASGLRPSGDIDLLIPRHHRDRAVMCLRAWQPTWGSVDLHLAPPDIVGRSFDELLRGSRIARLGAADVRIMADEEMLRLLCLHYLRHGAWRPLWLCDIALVSETLGEGFDWDRCLRGARRDRERIAYSLGLAADLLGAALPDCPITAWTRCVPGWMQRVVVTQWGTRYRRHLGPSLQEILRTGAAVLPALRARWPNPIEASVGLDAPLRFWPRWPIQLAEAAVRLGAFSRSVALPTLRVRAAPAPPPSSRPAAL